MITDFAFLYFHFEGLKVHFIEQSFHHVTETDNNNENVKNNINFTYNNKRVLSFIFSILLHCQQHTALTQEPQLSQTELQ